MAFINKYKNKLKISGIIWAVSLVVFALAYYFFVSPQNKAKRDIENKLAQSQQEYKMAQIAAKYENQSRINDEIGLLQDKLNDFVLNYRQAADLTFDISQIANECAISSCSVKSNDTQNTSDTGDPNNIFEKNIDVSFMAGFEEFALFLNSLERHKPVLFVHEFMLKRNNKDKETYQISLRLAALVRKQASEIQESNIERVVGFND